MTSRTTNTNATKHQASKVVMDSVSWPIGIAAYSPDGIRCNVAVRDWFQLPNDRTHRLPTRMVLMGPWGPDTVVIDALSGSRPAERSG